MARKRMIDPNLWQDEDIGSLSLQARLLFIGLFSNADDEGRIRANAAYLKSTVFMYDEVSLSNVIKFRDEVVSKIHSVKLYTVANKDYIQLSSWDTYQKQHKDRIQPSALPSPDHVSDNVGQTPDNVGQSRRSIDKISIDKIKLDKDKGSLTSLTDECLTKISEDYHVPMAFVVSKKEDLINYCKSKGKTYKDYTAALRNFVKQDAIKLRRGVDNNGRRTIDARPLVKQRESEIQRRMGSPYEQPT